MLQARHDDLEELYAFSSERKMASVLLREPDSLLLYNKARRARVTLPSPCMHAPVMSYYRGCVWSVCCMPCHLPYAIVHILQGLAQYHVINDKAAKQPLSAATYKHGLVCLLTAHQPCELAGSG